MQGTADAAVAAKIDGPAAPAAGRRSRIKSRPLRLVFYGCVVAALGAGWLAKDEHLITAEYGLGYLLGIVGATMMLLLLLYPVRKHSRLLRRLGPVRHWFRVHMVLGILGPVLVLFHANFELGSLNSRVALFCMLLVALSGFIGRYFYRKIHNGLYGRRLSLDELTARADALRSRPVANRALPNDLMRRLTDFERRITAPTASPLSTVFRPFTLNLRTRLAERRLHRSIRASLADAAAESDTLAAHRGRFERVATDYVSDYLRTVRRVAEFSLFERLFSLWHVLHLPFFFMLVVAAIVHVLAVHMY